MDEGDQADNAGAFPRAPGDRLRAARDAQGLSIADIAQRTRIPQRHLEAIESGAYSSLPSTTYAVGFAKAYARAVGVDEVSLASDVRAQLSSEWDRPGTISSYEIEDTQRVPSRGIVWGGVLVAVLLLIGVGLYYGTTIFRGGTTPASVAAPSGDVVAIPDASPPAPTPSPSAGQVTITATDEVWLRIYDAAGQTLVTKTMAPGERYDVPLDANGPMINVGRPDKLSVTVNGAAVAPLGDGRLAIKDVPVSAQALLARDKPAAAATPSAAPSATPTARATPSSSPSTPRARPSATPTPRATSTPRPAVDPTIFAPPSASTGGNATD